MFEETAGAIAEAELKKMKSKHFPKFWLKQRAKALADQAERLAIKKEAPYER